MTFEFPKEEHYSNPQITLDKNFLKGLSRLKGEKDKVTDEFFNLQGQCNYIFNANHTKTEFREIKDNFNNRIKSLFSGSDKRYPLEERTIGLCESCNKRRKLVKAHIIKKSIFKRPYGEWSFLRFHPSNILFICYDCHEALDGRFKDQKNEATLSLSAGKLNRINRNLRKKIKKIKKEMKSDEKIIKSYKTKISNFNNQKENMLSKLLRTLK